MATPIKVNRIGLEPQLYKGGKTTLCAGCGHNAITERIIDSFYELGIQPSEVIKLSGWRLDPFKKKPFELLEAAPDTVKVAGKPITPVVPIAGDDGHGHAEHERAAKH